MRKYQFYVMTREYETSQDMEDDLNQWSLDGWEFVQAILIVDDLYRMVFRREF